MPSPFYLCSFLVSDTAAVTAVRAGSGEPACPDGTFLAGYTVDGWDKWRLVCLDVEDVEDVYLFAGMTTGLLALGFVMLLQHQKLRKIAAEQTSVKIDTVTTRETVARMRSDISTAKEELTRVRANIATTREEVVRARADATPAERDE